MFPVRPDWLPKVFYGLLALTLLVYILRGAAVLSGVPGGIVSVLWMATLSLGVYIALLSFR